MQRDLDALASREHDLLVLGGGIVGAAAAWDAAQRGLSVALIEAQDFGAGTSWNSLKTIHGGLRYLQRFDLGGLRESVRERRALLRIAPSVVRPLSFVAPAQGRGRRGLLAYAIAARIYGWLSLDRNDGVRPDRALAAPRAIGARALAPLVPGLEAPGALVWQDAQVDRPEALLLAFVRAAAVHGAAVANYAEATQLVREGGRIHGARVRDTISGREVVVSGRTVLAALGGRLDDLLERSGLRSTRLPWLTATNAVLRTPPPAPVAIGGVSGGRLLFLVPWRDCTMIGTDYASRDAAHHDRLPALLADAARAFPFASCRREDVALVHRGSVLGEHAGALYTHDVWIDHAATGAPGLFSATAAKYTTARALAERSLDAVLRELRRPPVRCRTAETPLPIPNDDGLGLDDLVRRAVREEMALHLDDVVRRRTDVGTAGPPASDVLARIQGVLMELGWSSERLVRETRDMDAAYADRTSGGKTP